MTRAVAVIPARWASVRFPGKALVVIVGEPLVQHVWAAASGLDGQAPGNFGAARIQRGAKNVRRLTLQIIIRKRAQPLCDGAAVDDRAPIGDEREARRLPHQRSAARRFSA